MSSFAVDTLWWAGTPGRYFTLPDGDGVADAAPDLQGALHVSLSGRRTIDMVGVHRQWTWNWRMLQPADVAVVEAIQHGTIRGPLRLIDPYRPNRLPIQQAAGGSVESSPRGFAFPGAVLPGTFVDANMAKPETLGPGALVRGAVACQNSNGGGAPMIVASDGAIADRVPLLPGETVELSAWAAGDCPLAALSYYAWDLNGVAISPSSVPAGTLARPAAGGSGLFPAVGVALNTIGWTKLTLSLTVPAVQSSGVPAAIVPAVYTANGGSGTYLGATAWQVRKASAPPAASRFPLAASSLYLADDGRDASGGWSTGGGAPTVISGLASRVSFDLPGLPDVALTLLEV